MRCEFVPFVVSRLGATDRGSAHYSGGMSQIGRVDWDVAVATGRALVRPGPELAPAEIAAVVASLRSAADAAPDHIQDVSGLQTPAQAQTLVVDRPTWMKACAASFAAMLATIDVSPGGSSWGDALLGRVRGGEVGAVLAVMAPRILGQFDPFGEHGRLLLVAPNIVTVERAMGVRPSDFRLWVCLHEETHRFQFGEAPWLRQHVLGLMSDLMQEELAGAGHVPSAGGTILDMVLTSVQREIFDRITAVMSLVEGYADVMMDRVGTDVIPTLPAIRRAFERRRDRGGWSAVVGRLFGNDLKLAQYREGAAFCRAIIDEADVATLNAVWSGPEALPGLSEVRDPSRWLRRVRP